MISDSRILVNKLWGIRISDNPLEPEKKIDREEYWKRKAEEIIERFIIQQKRKK